MWFRRSGIVACVRSSPEITDASRKSEAVEAIDNAATITAERRSVRTLLGNLGNDVCKQVGEVKESAKALARRKAKMESEAAGVGVTYLIGNILRSLACGRTGLENPNFHDMAASFFHGPEAIARDQVCPRDGKMGCALVDILTVQQRGTANVFLSWVWSYSLRTFQEALSNWIEQTDDTIQTGEPMFFVCFFCNNQYRIIVDESQNGSDDLENVFESRLLACGKAVAVLDDWKQPVYCTRIWTIYEQFAVAKLGVPMELILPTKASESLLEQFMRGTDGIDEVAKSLGDVRSRDAVASRKVDEEKVKSMIENSVGFDTVDNKVVGCLAKCAAKQVQAYLGRNVHKYRKQPSEEDSVEEQREEAQPQRKWFGFFL